MIKLRGQSEVQHSSNKIVFEPRPGFIRGNYKLPELEFPLIYGHRCPYCNNVMQALFKAPKTFSLWPYEETTILSQGEKNAGDILSTYPDNKTRYGKSCYRIDFSPAEGGSVKITLKNHIMRLSAISERKFNGEGLWEEGKRTCSRTGVFSLREDLLVKDWLLFSHLGEYDINKYNIPPIKDIIKEGDVNFKLIPAVGVAPPVILVERHILVYGFHYQTRPIMQNFRKAGIQ